MTSKVYNAYHQTELASVCFRVELHAAIVAKCGALSLRFRHLGVVLLPRETRADVAKGAILLLAAALRMVKVAAWRTLVIQVPDNGG